MRILITGGCGFIGTNLVLDRVTRGDRVTVLDDCSRPGVERNRAYLEQHYATEIDLVEGDIRDGALVEKLVRDADAVVHLAAQVAVTGSVTDPRTDFEVNALGTLNVLEGARLSSRRPSVIYASTNKVYGGLEDLQPEAQASRYVVSTLPDGVSETRQLDFHSPYGCSKGAADQYTVDYARIYDIPTVVFRQSCIYGPWQYGNEDQGWLAHFVMRALAGEAITLYGDGRQVRDVLFVEDLLRLYDKALEAIADVAGHAFNVGGGPRFTTSLVEFVDLLRALSGLEVPVKHGEWRPGDQRVYISDVRRVQNALGWKPTTDLQSGTERLVSWIHDSSGFARDPA